MPRTSGLSGSSGEAQVKTDRETDRATERPHDRTITDKKGTDKDWELRNECLTFPDAVAAALKTKVKNASQ